LHFANYLTERFGHKPIIRKSQERIMLTKAALGLAIIVAAASGALAATRQPHLISKDQTIYNPYGAYVGTDPDQAVRFELRRDWTRGR
jgi:hypothetical protein